MSRLMLSFSAAVFSGLLLYHGNAAAASSTPSAAAAFVQTLPTETVQADQFIQNLGDRAVSILADKTLSAADKDRTFQDLMHASFDLPTIGRFVIGRNAWNGATPDEQTEYLRLFEQLVIRIYSDRFALYNGEVFKVVSSRVEGERDTMVTGHILRPGSSQPIVIDWRVRNFDGRLGIIDVIVEGISMSVTQRQEYSSVLAREDNKIGPLLDVMRKQLVKDDAQRKAETK